MATYRRIHQAEKLQKAFRHYGLGLNRPLKLPVRRNFAGFGSRLRLLSLCSAFGGAPRASLLTVLCFRRGAYDADPFSNQPLASRVRESALASCVGALAGAPRIGGRRSVSRNRRSAMTCSGSSGSFSRPPADTRSLRTLGGNANAPPVARSIATGVAITANAPRVQAPPFSSPSVIPRNAPPANHPVGAFNRSHQLGLRRISCWLDKNPSFSISTRRAASRRLRTTSTGVSPAWFPSTKTLAPGGDDSTVMRCVVPLVINVAHPANAARSKHATSLQVIIRSAATR